MFRLAATDAVRAALAAALAFLDAAEAAGNGAWRPHELPDGHEPDWAGALARAGITAEPVPVPPLPASRPPAPGPLGDRALHVLAPLGRLTATQLRALADEADELRLTPWRGVVAVTDPARLPALESYGLITRPDAPGTGVTACTGRPGCAKSLADVRTDALAAPPARCPCTSPDASAAAGTPTAPGSASSPPATTATWWTASPPPYLPDRSSRGGPRPADPHEMSESNRMFDYEKDGTEIYRRSFATIRSEADLAGLPADVAQVAVRMIHACGMTDLVQDIAYSPRSSRTPARP